MTNPSESNTNAALQNVWRAILELNSLDDLDAGGLGGTGIPDGEEIPVDEIDMALVAETLTSWLGEKPYHLAVFRSWIFGTPEPTPESYRRAVERDRVINRAKHLNNLAREGRIADRDGVIGTD